MYTHTHTPINFCRCSKDDKLVGLNFKLSIITIQLRNVTRNYYYYFFEFINNSFILIYNNFHSSFVDVICSKKLIGHYLKFSSTMSKIRCKVSNIILDTQ